MKAQLLFVVFFSVSGPIFGVPVTQSSSLVISTESANDKPVKDVIKSQVNSQIYFMQIRANVSNRFSRTLITTKVRNLEQVAKETAFSVIVPENAFISEFEMEIEEKVYKSFVKGKEEAKKIYEQAVSSGQSAAHVALNARDSKTFTVSVNIEPEKKTTFRLVYEELLQRKLGQYELVVNIHPGQLVEDFSVEVHINESRPLNFVHTPSLRTGNEISKNEDKLDPSAKIEIINPNSALIKFNPNVDKQKHFASFLGNEERGLAGQFVVQYDVERDPKNGEILVRDGYFVHFFAPSDLQPLPKHVVFILDHSGSMSGRKFEQLIEAMQNILTELRSDDLFNIVRFSNNAAVWSPKVDQFISVQTNSSDDHLQLQLKEFDLPEAAQANTKNIKKAKNVIQDNSSMLLTNIIDGLEVGLFLIKRTQEETLHKYQPMVVFLTDGVPNIGKRAWEITETITKRNIGTKAAIFSLSFGDGADKNFLKKLSSQNFGFSRHIYEAADASLQLQDFYRTISTALLSNITFKYLDGVSQMTKTEFPILFKGSELVVTGKINNMDVLTQVEGKCLTGHAVFNSSYEKSVSSLERLWAYLTVQQMLNERELVENKTELTKKALNLALKYSFVTSVSSLVVVKPNRTEAADSDKQDEVDGKLFSGGRRGRARSRTRSRIPWSIRIPTSTVEPSHENSTCPPWLSELRRNNGNISTPQGVFKLGNSGDVTTFSKCPKTPINGTGICTVIFDCEQVFSILINMGIYLKYFCPLNDYAGVCCPSNSTALY